jgi:hypothetical protein
MPPGAADTAAKKQVSSTITTRRRENSSLVIGYRHFLKNSRHCLYSQLEYYFYLHELDVVTQLF